MQIRHTQLEHFGHAYRWFSASKMDPDSLRTSAARGLTLIESGRPEERAYSIKVLGLLCFLELDRPNDISNRLLRVFEYHAQFSAFEDVRNGCIDAIYLSRDLQRLRSITFETGCTGSHVHRQRRARELQAELYPPMKC